MEEDVVFEDVIDDSDIELGPLVVPRASQREIPKINKNLEVRPPKMTYSFRKLRSKTFAQRHVYTLDLCKFLNLESEERLEKLAKNKTDEEIMNHLNEIYLEKKKHYDQKGLKRHKFMKQNFQIYVEDFKSYGASGKGKSFYDSIQDNNGSSSPIKEHTKDKNRNQDGSSSRSTSQSMLSQLPETDDLIPVEPSKRKIRLTKNKKPPKKIDFEFPSSQQQQQRPEQASILLPSSPVRSYISQNNESDEDKEEEEELQEVHPQIIPPSSPLAAPVAISVERLSIASQSNDNNDQASPHSSSNRDEVPNASQEQINEIHDSLLDGLDVPRGLHNDSRRSLRARKFSQNHVYTVDLCAYLGLATKTELDSFYEDGKTDREIFEKLDHLYEDRRKKYPHIAKAKFKFTSFAHHLEHHTKRYQKQIEQATVPQDSYNSSLSVEQFSASSDDDEASNVEGDGSDIEDQQPELQQRRRLKGVLPFSYLKLQGNNVQRYTPNPSKRTSELQTEKAGLARRRKRKAHHANDNFNDFIDDEVDAAVPYDPYNIDASVTNMNQEMKDVSNYGVQEASHDEDLEEAELFSVSSSSDVESEVESYGRNVSSSTLFGMAEEVSASGVDPMLSRSYSTKPKGQQRSKKKQHKKLHNYGTSSWSTKSNRVYIRKPSSSIFSSGKKKQHKQQSLPFYAMPLDNDDDGVTRIDQDMYHEPTRFSNKLLNSLIKPSLRRPLSHMNTNLGGKVDKTERQIDKDMEQERKKRKKPQQAHFYGVTPNLSVHSLSRTPQSFTTQLEGQNHKYKIIKQKNLSKENLNPLEPAGIYQIPSAYENSHDEPVFIVDDDDSSSSTMNSGRSIFDLCDEITQLHKGEKGKLTGHMEALKANGEKTQQITWTFQGQIYTLAVEKSSAARAYQKLEKSFNDISNSVKEVQSIDKHYIEIENFFFKMIEWIELTKDRGLKFAIDTMELLQVFKITISNALMNNFVSKKDNSSKSLLKLASLCVCLFAKCAKASADVEISAKAKYHVSSVVQIYLLCISTDENVQGFVNWLKDLENYDSFLNICDIQEYVPEMSIWAEFGIVAQKFSQMHLNQNQILNAIKIVATLSNNCLGPDGNQWKCFTVLIKANNKLSGFEQQRNIRTCINTIFELNDKLETWDLDESMIRSVYDIISHCKFRNFTGEKEDLSLKTGSFFNIKNDPIHDTILDSYFKLLTIYLNQFTDKTPVDLVEKIMPISSIDSSGYVSNSVLVNRTNVLLVYSNLFHTTFIKQMNVLYKNFERDTDQTLQIKFDSLVMMMEIHKRYKFKLPMESIRQIILVIIEKFNMALTVRLNLQIIQEKANNLQKIMTTISGFFDTEHINVLDLIKLVNEILELKFHATPVLQKILYSAVFLIRRSVHKASTMQQMDEKLYLKKEFYESVTRLLGAQLSIFDPLRNNETFNGVSLLMSVWCDFSKFLILENLDDWNSILFYHWNNIAGSKQRECFELSLLETILDNHNETGEGQFMNSDYFLKALSRHLVKFNGKRMFSFLTKLIKFNEKNNNMLFTKFFQKLNNQEEFESQRVQTVIAYVYYLKALAQSSMMDFKIAENLLNEMIISLRQEYHLQAKLITNFTWFDHFATKIMKFINYSCFELVKGSVDFSQLRAELKISYHSDIGYAEDFKTKLSACLRLEDSIRMVEKEFLSSIIQGEEAILRLSDIFQSLMVEQMYNNYDTTTTTNNTSTSIIDASSDIIINGGVKDSVVAESSPLFLLTTLIVSHLQILSNRQNCTMHWFMVLRFIQILIGSTLQKGSLHKNDIFCLIKMIQSCSIINNIEVSFAHATIFKNLTMIEIYELSIIVYNLTNTYADQQKFAELLTPFIDLSNITNSEASHNKDYLDCIRVLNEEIHVPHQVYDNVAQLVKSQDLQVEESYEVWKIALKRFVSIVNSDHGFHIIDDVQQQQQQQLINESNEDMPDRRTPYLEF